MAVTTTSFSIVDRCTLIYNALVLGFILLFHSRIPSWPLLTVSNFVVIAYILLVVYGVGDHPSTVARLVRHLYPTVFFAIMYGQTEYLNRLVFPEFLDPLFQRMEAGVFGLQPAQVLAQWFPQKWLAEYMHFAYFSYYPLFIGLGAFLLLRRGRRPFFDFMFSMCATMYTCYVIYIFLPVLGGRSFNMGDAPGNGPFTAVMGLIYHCLEVEGAAFPSSHVAIATVVLYYTFRYARPAAWVLTFLIISLMVSTVYCRYHYAIDVLAGLATAALLIPLWRRINPVLKEAP